MTQNNQTYNLFTPSGCMTIDALKKHLNSDLTNDEVLQVKEHLESCEMCRDAVEGLELLSDKSKLEEIVAEINDNLQKNLNEKTASKTITLQSKVFYLSAAASIIVLIGLLYYFNNRSSSFDFGNSDLAQEVKVEKNTVPLKPKIVVPVTYNDTEDNDIGENESIDISTFPEEEEKDESENIGKEINYSIPLDKIKSKDSQLIKIAKELEDLEKPIVQTEEIKYPDIASTQPIQYYLSEVVVPNIKIGSSDVLNLEDQSSLSEHIKSQNAKHFFAVVEKMPEFPGGYSGLTTFLSNNLEYPKNAKKNNIEGRVILSFEVGETGIISNIHTLRGIGGGCDEEAIRVINMMPAWEPAYQNGQSVKVLFTIPIKFEIL